MEGTKCAIHARTRKRKELEKVYAALSKEVNKSVRKDYQVYVIYIANEAQVPENQGNIRGMFSPIRHLMNNVQPATVPIRDKEGKTINLQKGKFAYGKSISKRYSIIQHPSQEEKNH